MFDTPILAKPSTREPISVDSVLIPKALLLRASNNFDLKQGWEALCQILRCITKFSLAKELGVKGNEKTQVEPYFEIYAYNMFH